jgi:3-mercaptopropionate dioxygenase
MSDEFVLDTAVVRDFVADVRGTIATAQSPNEACGAIEPRFAELLADPDWLPPEYQAAAPDSGMGGGIGQWLLYRAEDQSLSLFSLVVPPGSATPIHDHLAWGLVGLYRGEQDEEIYAQRDGALELVERRSLVPGDFYVLIPPRRHPPGAHDLRRYLGLDPPADERHRLRLAPLVRRCIGRGEAVPLRLRQRGV